MKSSSERRLCAALLSALLWAAPGVATAAPNESRTVAVIDLSSDTRAHAQVRREVVRAIAKRDGTTVRDLDGILNGGGEVDAQARLRTAEAFYESGVSALLSGDANEAADQLENAAGLMEQDYALLEDRSLYRALLLHLGEAQLKVGLAPVAKATFHRAAVFRARPRDVDDRLSARAESALNQAVAALAEVPLGAVSVTTTPSHAEVWVDGRYKGVSPKTVAGLTAGDHLLVIRKPGYSRITLPLRADPDELTLRSVILDPARRKPVWDQMLATLDDEVLATAIDNPQAGPGVEQVGSILLADLGVVIRCASEGDLVEVELTLYDTRSQRLLNRVAETVNWSARNREAIVSLVDRLTNIDYVAALGGASEPYVARSSLTDRWWFWTALAAGAATVTTAIILATSDEDLPPVPTTGTVVIRF